MQKVSADCDSETINGGRGSGGLQARIQEFQNGGARSRRGRILRSKVCFDASLLLPYVFVRRVVNNIHIVNTAC